MAGGAGAGNIRIMFNDLPCIRGQEPPLSGRNGHAGACAAGREARCRPVQLALREFARCCARGSKPRDPRFP